MKAVCYILTVYFLSLTGIPCADNIAHSPESDNVSFWISGADGAGDNHGTGDECSTMCGCHCCHVHVLMTPQAALGPLESTSTDYIDIIDYFTNAVIAPFLKPPMAA